MKSLIVVPTYNEVENLQALLEEIVRVTPGSVHVLVADDGSPDGTGQVAEALSQKEPRIHVLHREKKMGLGPAYVAGFQWGLSRGYDHLIEMDADFSHHPKYLATMLETLNSYDGALGSRYVSGGGTVNWGLGRKILSRGGSLYARWILGAPLRDFTGGFNGWRREVLEQIGVQTLKSDGYSFQIELKYRAHLLGYRLKEFPIVFEDRKVGRSKMSRRIVIEALRRVWSFRFMKSEWTKRMGKVASATGALILGLMSPDVWGAPAGGYSAILVDKKKNELHLTEWRDGVYALKKTFHVTLGKVKGDKEEEGDNKTPEGIYVLESKILPPTLKPKFGMMAFRMNYPNAFDRIAGRTGTHIMLHATNEPERLKQNYDSEGCVVVENAEIDELSRSIRVGLTPILVFEELKSEDWKPAVQGSEIRKFFDSWIQAWESRDVDRYMQHYHSDFVAQGKDFRAWKDYKRRLTERYRSIRVGPEDVLIYRHPKYWMMTFTQNYRSELKGGRPGHRSRGTKILYVAQEEGKPKIIAETYTTLMW